MSTPTNNGGPITHGGTNRGYKLCKCCTCGIEEKCTPHRDFYTLGEDWNGPLYCEGCFRKAALAARNQTTK